MKMQLDIAIVIVALHALSTTVYAAPLYTSNAQPHSDPKLQELERTQILTRDVEATHSLYPRLLGLGRKKNQNRQDLEMGPLLGAPIHGESSSMHPDTPFPPSPPARVSQLQPDHSNGEQEQELDELPGLPPPAHVRTGRRRPASEPAIPVTVLQPEHPGNHAALATTTPRPQGWSNWRNWAPRTRADKERAVICSVITAACGIPLLVQGAVGLASNGAH